MKSSLWFECLHDNKFNTKQSIVCVFRPAISVRNTQ